MLLVEIKTSKRTYSFVIIVEDTWFSLYYTYYIYYIGAFDRKDDYYNGETTGLTFTKRE